MKCTSSNTHRDPHVWHKEVGQDTLELFPVLDASVLDSRMQGGHTIDFGVRQPGSSIGLKLSAKIYLVLHPLMGLIAQSSVCYKRALLQL